jgi:hypothetical protein
MVVFALSLGACAVASHSSDVLARTPQTGVTPTTAATSGPVTLALGKPRYALADTIEVTIHNGLHTPIFARNEHSDCTLVDLERWVNGTWQVEAPCVNMVPKPTIIQLAPDADLTQRLAPGQSDVSSGSWPIGTYRVALAYVMSAGQPFGQSTVAYSANFNIG